MAGFGRPPRVMQSEMIVLGWLIDIADKQFTLKISGEQSL